MSIKRLLRMIFSIMPLFIIAGLLYVALYIKPETGIAVTDPYPIVKRDRFYGVVSPSPSTIWAVGGHGKVVRSDDSGVSWVLQSVPEKVNLQGISAWDDNRAIVVGNAATVMITSDGGKIWTKVKTPLDDPIKKEVSEDAGVVLAVGGMTYGRTAEEELEQKAQVAEAAEAAMKWRQKLLKVLTLPDGNAWIVGEMGIVLNSNDFGATWKRMRKSEDSAWNSIAVVGNNCLLVGEAGRIMKSSDAGETWVNIKSPVQGSLMDVAFRDKNNGVIVGLQGTVLVTKDGGTNWVHIPPVTREHLFDIMWDESESEWVAVGDKGIMVKGDPSGVEWSSKRITDLDTSWYTCVVKSGDRYYMSGARLSTLNNGDIRFFDNKI